MLQPYSFGSANPIHEKKGCRAIFYFRGLYIFTRRKGSMVYCAKCGAQNEEGASNCVNCGASLRVSRSEKRDWEEELEVRAEDLGERAERFGRRMEEECFGLPGGSSIIGILIGIAIILVGARELFGWNIDIGPFAIIAVGVLIVAGALYRQSQGRPRT
jgi:ribosomal protein L40E